ncbi:glycerophosphoryl diester phosphodiesterase [Duganella sp. 1411]|uniref:glycerophosphodiester phosphodiesterase n=1 Tax=Duganella sp. 1411 TaxID=2806572 RepID=UPI001AEB1D9C|nr:glycerophosphodiester phosphodiesterase [Duganella sp. 1411]MBP1207591.1 glycerophosphoryl diester phosphodiesterase [Duganella sp. 1411]
MWPYPKIVAHRGGGTVAPENTVAGLRAGLAYGFHAVEFDVMLSRDGIGMVMHDADFGRTVAGRGSVPGTDAVDLAGMDAGSWFGPQFQHEPVPYYTQFIDYCKAQRIWMNVEIKPADGFEADTGRWVARVTRDSYADEIAAGDPAAVPLLSSFSFEALAAARDAAPDLPRGYLLDRIPDDWQAQARELGAVAIHTNHKHLTRELAQAIKAAGYGLFCYTVNDPGRGREILSWGVDGFCTDRIDLIGPGFA